MDNRDEITKEHFNQKVTFETTETTETYSLGGRLVDAAFASRLNGAPDGARITLRIVDQISAKFTTDHTFFSEACEREIQSYDGGFLLMINEVLMLKPCYQGKGYGIRMFAQEAHAAREAGISQIWLMAAGRKDDTRYNGYYSWARYGFDAALEPADTAKLPVQYQRVKTVQELMNTAEGKELWREHGTGRMMCFDLADAECWKVLAAYMAHKGVFL